MTAARPTPDDRVLVLAPTGKDAALTRDLLGRAGVAAVCCPDLGAVCAELAAGAGAVLLAEEAVGPGRTGAFTDWLAAQPPWSDLPVLLLARAGADSPAVARAIEVLGNVTVLERPTRVATVVTAVRTALRARRRQYQAREHLLDRERAAAELQTLMDVLPVGVFIAHDPACRRITGNRAGSAILRMAGDANLSKSAPAGERPTHFRPSRDGAEIPPADLPVQRAARGEVVRDEEVDQVFDDGTVVHTLISAAPLFDPAGAARGAVAAVTDITARKRTAEELRRSEERLRVAVAAAKLGQWDLDLRTLEMTCSDTCRANYGRRPGDRFTYADLWDTVHPGDRDRVREAVRTAVDTRTDYDTEYRTVWPDGTLHWVIVRGRATYAADGTPLTMVGVTLDITDRKRSEDRVRDTERRFRELVEQVRDYAIFTTDPAGRATSWNEGVRRVLGFDEAEFLGADMVPSIFTPEDVAAGVPEAELGEAAATGRAGNDRWMRRKDGTRFFALGVTTGLRDGAGNLLGFLKVMRDQTDRKRMEDELRRVAADLAEADRRKNEFLATLAHELRNPLAPVRNALHVLRLAPPGDPAAARVGEMVERQVNLMVRLVDDLLEVSRVTRGKIDLRREPVELAGVVRAAVETSRPLLDAGAHRLTVSAPDAPLAVDGDPVRLAQVFSNLLNNAAKYTPPGGRVWLTVRRDGGEAEVSVRDTGVGIPADMLRAVFEPFTQVARTDAQSQGGLGIGLTLVKNLVELHGGRVEARSDGEGRGTEVVVRLPLTARPVAAPPPQVPGRTAPLARRVLVADDNRDAADSLGDLLRLLGADVRVVYDGPAAVAAVDAFRPAVALLDLGMPGMDGYEVARRVRERHGADPALVALTGWGQDEDRRRSAAAGFDHHLVKPADVAALAALLRSVGNGHP